MSSYTSHLKSQVVKAGAGTGKTTCLVEKIFERYKNKNNNLRLIVCTFTKKATQELKEKLLKEALKHDDLHFLKYINSPSLSISTIHGILNIFLKEYGSEYGLNFNFRFISEKEELQILQSIAIEHLYKKEHFELLKNLSFDHIMKILKFYTKQKMIFPDIEFANEQSFQKFNNQFHEECNQLKQKETQDKLKTIDKKRLKIQEQLDSINFIPWFEKMKKIADEFHHNFLEEKKKMNVLTYDDLELFSLDIIRKNPKTAQSFSKEWDYWFIDEYQDTSLIQEKIFEKFTQFKNVFCVGDPQQSIYAFRGADPDVFNRRVADSKMEKKVLETNYRSKPSLIYFFNDFFKKEKDFLPLKPQTEVKSSKPIAHILKYNNEITEIKEDECFKAIAYQIQKLHKQGVKYKDICVLNRKNDVLSSLFLYLRNKNIPSQIQSGENFSHRRIILDSLFALRFLINSHDKENVIALLRTPYFFVSDEELSHFCKDYHELFNDRTESDIKLEQYISFWKHIKNSKHTSIVKLNQYLELKKELGLVNTFEKIIFENGFMDLISLQYPSGLEESYLWKLLSTVRKQEKMSDKSLLNLFYSITEDQLDQEAPKEMVSFSDSKFVKLMTIHQSKGLEFENVLIFDLSEKTPPVSKDFALDLETKKIFFSVPPKESIFGTKIKCYGHHSLEKEEKEKSQAELKRLMYVAMTRAKNSVSFFTPIKPKKNIFSLFNIDEIPENPLYLIEKPKDIEDMLFQKSSFKKSNVLVPFKEVNHQKFSIKSAKDFINETEVQSQISSKFILPQFKNIFFKTYLGNQMHNVFQLLNKHPFPVVQEKVKCMNLREEDKEKIHQSLDYIHHLKDPDLNYFIREGYVEWPFQLKTSEALLKGRIDLWGKDKDSIWIFDYKSSSSKKSKDLFKQISFYAYALNQIYQPKKIFMCGIYPLERVIKKEEYSTDHKKQILSWLEKVKVS